MLNNPYPQMLTWQPNGWAETCFNLTANDETLATYRRTSHLKGTVKVTGPQNELILQPRVFKPLRVTEANGLHVADIKGGLNRKGRFTTTEGDTYTWETTNFWSTERVFRQEDGTEVLRVRQPFSLRTRIEVFLMPGTSLPPRDATLLMALAMHMILAQQIFVVIIAILPIIILPAT